MITPFDFDRDLLLALNFDGGPVLDALMYAISWSPTWIPLYLAILWLLWRKAFRNAAAGTNGLSGNGLSAAAGPVSRVSPEPSRKIAWNTLFLFLAAAALVVLFCDQTATQFKTHLPKFRPTHYPPIEGMVHSVYGYLGGLYGTVSGHAANSFGVAILSSLALHNKGFSWFIFLWAVAVSYSRIYLGVHYPMDILCGTAAGLLWGWCGWKLWDAVVRKKPQLFVRP